MIVWEINIEKSIEEFTKPDYQLIGGSEKGDREYNRDRRLGQLAYNGTLIDKAKVKNATTNYKAKKIGSKVGIVAYFKPEDKLAA